ncbi:MAG: type I-MYXAN CRISPR-associated protein Cas6/Cmx6 [Acidiferrobacteraceae bacterium]|nr:type I-MYXAN CRISPR-associated protein Cas6/Cmx6 [Acidiferrobacteraceae bacterium]|tara:strand:+ start:942 stop:1613 length:672 start_codon:yes stop_codon:yes gene_type:complete
MQVGLDSQMSSKAIDLLFRMSGNRLPTDYAWGLSEAIQHALPWLENDEESGIHHINILESGSGWQRPLHEDWIHLSKRSRLMLRIRRERIQDANALCNLTLNFLGCSITIGRATPRELSPITTLYARHVATPTKVTSEEKFIDWSKNLIGRQGAHPITILCGQERYINTPDGTISTRSLMIDNLAPSESLLLQQSGIGPYRQLGCGLFLPHRGIAEIQNAKHS